MRRRRGWTLLVVALVLAGAGALAPAASAKPPKPAPPTTTAPTTTGAAPHTGATKQAPATTTTAPPTTTAPTPTTLPPPTFGLAAAPVAEPRITVTPNRDLVPFQEVQVSGSGYTPGERVNVVACRAGATTAFDGCDIGNVAFLEADANGDWSSPFTVHVRISGTDNRRTDCAADFGACVISGTHGDGFTTDPSAPIGFDSEAIPDPPNVTVTPRTGLAHGQQVTVSGTGAPPDVVLFVGECVLADNRYPDCASDAGGFVRADANGNFELPVTVARLFGYGYPGSQTTDCLVDECVIRSVALDGLDNVADVRITFDPKAPLPPRPNLTVTPDDDLVHDQVVHVSGSGFVPDVAVQLIECSVDGDPYPQCAYDTYQNVQADANGNIDATLTVKRVLGYPGQSVDCLVFACVVHANSNVNDPFESIDVPIAFDPDVPLPPPPVVTITPDRDLRHNDLLSVRGKGFSPDTFVQLTECTVIDEAEDTYGDCTYRDDDLRTDENGDFTTTFAVKRVFGYPGRTADCLDVVGCELLVYAGNDPLLSFAEVELDFDPDAPLPPPPVLTVTPHQDLGGRELVSVHGEGFAPESDHNLAECSSDIGPINGTPCTWGTTVRTDEDGNFETSFLARRYIAAFPEPVDCVTTATCVVSALSYEDVLSQATAPVAFDPDAPPPTRPTITVTPSEGLTDDAVVTVTGRDFVPNAGIGVSECKGSDPSGLACDTSIATFLTTDDQGSFTVEYRVRPGIVIRDGIVGCYDAPGACTIQAATFGEVDGVSNAVPLTFGASVTPPGDGSGGGGGGASDRDGGGAPGPAPRAPRLAFTGTPVAGYLEFAAIFLGLGTLLVLAARRRRT